MTSGGAAWRAELSARVRAEIKKRGRGGQTKLAHELGVSVSAVTRWMNGDNLPARDMLPRLAKALRVPAEHLLGLEAAASQDRLAVQAPGPTRALPLFDEPVAAGHARIATDAEARIDFPASLLEFFLGEPADPDPYRYCFVEVHGDSMAPTITHGSRLLVDCGPGGAGWPEIEQGAIYVIAPPGDDGGTTKRLFLTETELIVWADNPTFGHRRWSRERLAHEDRAMTGIARGRVVAVMTKVGPETLHEAPRRRGR